MKRFLFLAVVVCVTMCSAAYAADEAVGFKGINLGSDISEMEKDSRYKCHPDGTNVIPIRIMHGMIVHVAWIAKRKKQ